ncbi:MAG: hypothetical protein ACR2NI_12195 [Pirellulales bacterium]
MACNSRLKGKNGELEAAHALNDVLPHAKARRAQQFAGHHTAADLVCEGLPGIMVEVKRKQSLNLHKTMDKSLEDCGEDQTPVIIHRKDNCEWLLTVRLEDVPAMMWKFLREGSPKGANKDVEPRPD